MQELSLIKVDPWLKPFEPVIERRHALFGSRYEALAGKHGKLAGFASAHHYYGLHKTSHGWVFREWAPNASKVFMVGEFSNWHIDDRFALTRLDEGDWEITLPERTLQHGDLYKLHLYWPDGNAERLPAYANRVVQDTSTLIFSAQVWCPEHPYSWNDHGWQPHDEPPLIYEAHIGMSSEAEKVSTYTEFKNDILPRIVKGGYNTIQLMAIQEHPYYGSFGYHVSNFFAATSKFGTPEDLKALIDEAHRYGINVIMDLVHSHAVKNEVEGLGRFDGTLDQYFYPGDKGFHPAWDSRCFDYGKTGVLRFLLSNVRFWLEEYHFDGFPVRWSNQYAVLTPWSGGELYVVCRLFYGKRRRAGHHLSGSCQHAHP
ncbi:MAG: alpha-amylase family glycosyl hydrolase [Breznakibacter sp.]